MATWLLGIYDYELLFIGSVLSGYLGLDMKKQT